MMVPQTDPYLRIVETFDARPSAGKFLREDGEGGIASGVERMANEIERLEALVHSAFVEGYGCGREAALLDLDQTAQSKWPTTDTAYMLVRCSEAVSA